MEMVIKIVSGWFVFFIRVGVTGEVSDKPKSSVSGF
jgi:hypothetical protein